MGKPRVRMLKDRTEVVSTQAVAMLDPDAWREGLTTAQRGYGGRWQRARLTYLARHPLCVVCEASGVVTAANVVDHINDHRGDMHVFWDTNNWQALCKRHHDEKTSASGGIGHARRG